MVDNFKQIEGLLVFPHKDSFYFVQIIQRKKDHPGERVGGSNNNSRLIKAYYIKSIEHLNVHKEEMIMLANVFNARVQINLNPRSFEKTAFHLLIKVANQMHNKDFGSITKAYESVCGLYQSEMDKRWLVDIDKEQLGDIAYAKNGDGSYRVSHNKLEAIQNAITELQDEITNRDYGVLAVIPSKSGYHIITNPFNLKRFGELWPGVEVHKNNPTNLYIPDGKEEAKMDQVEDTVNASEGKEENASTFKEVQAPS